MQRGVPLPSFLVHLLSVVVLIAALYLGRDILLPAALALLVSLLLAPAVARLQKARLRRTPAVILVVTLLFALVGGLGWFVTSRLAELALRLPQYRENLVHKMQALQGPAGSVLGRAFESVQSIGREVAEASQPKVDGVPIPRVQVVRPPPSALELLSAGVASAVRNLGSAAVVVLLVVFLLVYQEDLRDRVAQLVGVSRVNLTLRMIDEAVAQTSRYLLIQTGVNLIYGALLAGGLFLLGIPDALLWGILGVVLRFIPYLGPWIAASLPCLLSLAVFDGWTRPLVLVAYVVLLELLVNNLAEPLLYGQGTGLSPLAVVVSSIFWAWLWGGVGLLLAVPLTAALLTLGRHLPPLRFLDLLLGGSPRLSPELRLYQRLLAGDLESAVELVEARRREAPLAAVYDGLLLPALALAEQNRHWGDLEEEHADAFFDQARRLIEELDGEGPPPEPDGRPGVLLVPASDAADELSARLLARLLRAEGLRARVLDAQLTIGEKTEEALRDGSELVALSSLPPGGILPARYFCKRLRARAPGRPLVVGLWTLKDDAGALKSRIAAEPDVDVVLTLEEALRRLRERAAGSKAAAAAEPAR